MPHMEVEYATKMDRKNIPVSAELIGCIVGKTIAYTYANNVVKDVYTAQNECEYAHPINIGKIA